MNICCVYLSTIEHAIYTTISQKKNVLSLINDVEFVHKKGVCISEMQQLRAVLRIRFINDDMTLA